MPTSEEQTARGAPAPIGVRCHFNVYRDKRVRLTSTLFSGADWHWRLFSPDGEVLAVSDGYATEAECRASIDAVRKHAATATVTKPNE
jgi:uncharacterized protein YegP (UPF0339 family)